MNKGDDMEASEGGNNTFTEQIKAKPKARTQYIRIKKLRGLDRLHAKRMWKPNLLPKNETKQKVT